jgi:hypothetical protein
VQERKRADECRDAGSCVLEDREYVQVLGIAINELLRQPNPPRILATSALPSPVDATLGRLAPATSVTYAPGLN